MQLWWQFAELMIPEKTRPEPNGRPTGLPALSWCPAKSSEFLGDQNPGKVASMFGVTEKAAEVRAKTLGMEA